MPSHLKLRSMMITLLFLAATMMAAYAATVSAADVPAAAPQVVARVNGVPIYNSDLAPSVEKRIAQYRQLGSKANAEELRKRFQLKELDGLIARELLVQAGANIDSKDIEQRVEKRLAGSAAGKDGQKSRSEEQLATAKAKLRRDILIEDYLESRGLLNPKIDDQELRRFYDKNRQSFHEPKTIKASHILVMIPKNATPEQEKEAWVKAEKILAKLKNGGDFAQLAKQNSDCASKANGGDLGFIKLGFMPKEFDDAAFKLKPGEISGIVKTGYGLHIIRVSEVRPEGVRSFDEVKTFIAGYMRSDYQREKVDELVQELKKSARIEVLIN